VSIFPNPRADRNAKAPIGDHARALAEIRTWPYYALTPLIRLDGLARGLGVGSIHYKDEAHRFGLRSFKALGGAYAVLRVIQQHVAASSADLRLGAHADIAQSITVTTATDGNHGRAVAWGASQFGCRAVIYVPRACSPAREHAIAGFGAQVIRTTLDYDDTVRQCADDAKRNGWQVVTDTSWEGFEEIPKIVMEGYTVMATEACEQIGESPTHVFVQAGVGGLAAAVCGHFPESRFIVVEPEHAAGLFASARAGRPERAPGEVHTVMAGLECGEVSPIAWRILDRGADYFMTVRDSAVPPCLRLLAKSPHGDPSIFAGESAVAGLIALVDAARDPEARALLQLGASSRILLFGTEGITDPIIWRELIAQSDPLR
jgi:diaminopropionate ammonia-lyase